MDTKEAKQQDVKSSSATLVKADAGPQADVSREFHKFLADIEDLIKETSVLSDDEFSQAKEKLYERVAAAKESVEAMSGEIALRARKTAAETNDYVHKQPWQAIGIGTTIGLLLGFLLTQRIHTKSA